MFQPIQQIPQVQVPAALGGQAGQAGQAGQGNLPAQPNFNTVNQQQQQRAVAGQQIVAIDQQLGQELSNISNVIPIQQGQLLLTLTDAINQLTTAVNNMNTNMQASMLATNFNHLACLQNRHVQSKTHPLKRMRDVNTNLVIQAFPRNIDDIDNFGRPGLDQQGRPYPAIDPLLASLGEDPAALLSVNVAAKKARVKELIGLPDLLI